MAKRWSRLQSAVYKILDDGLDLQIHCTPYRMKSQRGSSKITRYWITLGKEIIFDVVDGPYSPTISAISDKLREYVVCPREELFKLTDDWKILDVLRAADRRLGREALLAWGSDKPENIRKILAARFRDNL
jgi:hypothetical protein